MSRPLPFALVQAPPRLATDPLAGFAEDVEGVLARFPQTRLIAYPELHLCGVDGPAAESESRLQAAAEPLDGPRVKLLAELAGDLGIWLFPGTVCERGAAGELFNTALALSPQGQLVAHYRKIFPWRPYEPYAPGDRFVVVDLPEAGRVGFAICYDAWFPEVARHLAWMGAEELVIAQANAIVNQVYVVSVNTAGPIGTGRSLVVDPEGRIRVQASDSGPTVLTDVLDLDDVTRVRAFGTAGLNRMWDHFTDTDAPIDLPLYDGRLDPRRWRPADN
jgi:predicted amidohydrolase